MSTLVSGFPTSAPIARPVLTTSTSAGPSSLSMRRGSSSFTGMTSGSASRSVPACPLLVSSKIPTSQLPKAVMSLSLGKNSTYHTFARKAAASKAAGMQGIEVHFDDVEAAAKSIFRLSDKPNRDQILAGAARIRAIADEAGLSIICLEPILHYPGVLPISRRDDRLRDEFPLWLAVTDVLGTSVIQVASAMFGGEDVATGDESRVVEDLTLLAELGLSWRGVQGTGPLQIKYFAYESMCFGAYATTWEQAWRHVELVDRPNFGMVFDTFQILGGCYADPSAIDGKAPNADDALDASMKRMRSIFQGPHNENNRQKVFFVQLGDASLPEPRMSKSHPLYDPTQHANLKMCWARNYRQFQGEGYLPCNEVASVFFEECGWRGWISHEYFNIDQVNDSADYPLRAAKRSVQGCEVFFASITAAAPSSLDPVIACSL